MLGGPFNSYPTWLIDPTQTPTAPPILGPPRLWLLQPTSPATPVFFSPPHLERGQLGRFNQTDLTYLGGSQRGELANQRQGRIEGKMKDIMAFLDRLSYGDNIPPEIAHTREVWRRKWRENAWSRGKGQGA